MLTIELDRCDGCGDCVEVCPAEAIQLVEGKAQIDPDLCIECEVCVKACPKGAIKVARPVAVREEPAAAMEERPRPSGLAALAGAALSFVGRRVLPRAAGALVNALDRRISRGAAGSPAQPPSSGARGQRRRRRRRGR